MLLLHARRRSCRREGAHAHHLPEQVRVYKCASAGPSRKEFCLAAAGMQNKWEAIPEHDNCGLSMVGPPSTLTPLVIFQVLRGLWLAPFLRRMPCRHRCDPAPCSSSSRRLLRLLLLTPAIRLNGCASAIGCLPRGLLPSGLVRAPRVNLFHRRWRWRSRPSLLLPANIQMPLCLQKAEHI